jgi:hypothetical protein
VGCPEVVCLYGLGDAVGCDASIGPCHGAVAVTDRPVALIGSEWSILNFEENVRSMREFRSKTRLHCDSPHRGGPYRELCTGQSVHCHGSGARRSGVRAIDETKIYGGLMCVSVIDLPEQNGPYVVKSAWVRGWIVLQEKPSDGRIINIFIRIYSW